VHLGALGMKRILIAIAFILSLITSIAFAQDIASCSNPKGKSYFPELGQVSKNMSGWVDDGVSGGITTVKKIAKDKYDIVFYDVTKRIISSVEDGGNVLLLNKGKNVFSILVIYPGKTAEIFTFLKNKSNKLEFIQITSRAGDAVSLTKSSMFRGECEFIDFNSL
jgi:hypothetical protein